MPTVAMPSCSAARGFLDLLDGLPGVAEVRVALDADFRTNPAVARAVLRLLGGIGRLGRRAVLEVWDAKLGKGIDDALVAGATINVFDPDESRRVAAEAVAATGATAAAGGSRDRLAEGSQGENGGPGTTPPPRPPAAPGGAGPAGGGDPPPARDLADPAELADRFLDRGLRRDGRPLLRRHRQQWHRWDGAAWPEWPDDDLRAAVVRAVEREFAAEAAGRLAAWTGKGDPPVARKASCGLVENVLQAVAARTLLPSAVEPPAWIDRAAGPDVRDCVFARNGVLHVPSWAAGRADALTPPSPASFNHSALPFDFDPHAPPPREWLRFLGSVWPDDPESVGMLQEWFGYCVTPDCRQQKVLLIVGPPRSGKGTVARVLSALVGAADVCAPTLGSLADRFGLWPLLGKSLAVVGEAQLSGRADAAVIAERLKSISGEDLQTVDRKNRPPVSVRLGVRFLLLANEVPRLSDASAAVASRLAVLLTGESHLGREDLGLEGRLLAELPGVLLWALDGWRRLSDRGRFAQPASGAEAVREVGELASPVTAFVAARCRLGDGLRVEIGELYRSWRAWCDEAGHDRPGPANLFVRNLRSAFPSVRTGRVRRSGERPRVLEGIGPADLVLPDDLV